MSVAITVGKVPSYSKTVAISVIRAGSVKLSRYRPIEQVLQNCRNIGHLNR